MNSDAALIEVRQVPREPPPRKRGKMFQATFITDNPCVRDAEPQSLVYYLDPGTKGRTRSDFVAELSASRVKISP